MLRRYHGRMNGVISPFRLRTAASSKLKVSIVRTLVVRAASLASLCLLALCCDLQISNAQVSDDEKASYLDALAYCSGVDLGPMVLRDDKKVLCLDGWFFSGRQVAPVDSLETGGYFVVRGFGGDIAATIALADKLREKRVTVVIYDYCVAACASYLLLASEQAFVPSGALVAWINVKRETGDCLGFQETSDRAAPRLELVRCPASSPDVYSGFMAEELNRRKMEFFRKRVFPATFSEPPESLIVRRVLKRKFDETGRYPDKVYWTWNPRYYAGAIRTKVIYEAYPQSQDEVDAIVARIQLSYPVIYDP